MNIPIGSGSGASDICRRCFPMGSGEAAVARCGRGRSPGVAHRQRWAHRLGQLGCFGAGRDRRQHSRPAPRRDGAASRWIAQRGLARVCPGSAPGSLSSDHPCRQGRRNPQGARALPGQRHHLGPGCHRPPPRTSTSVSTCTGSDPRLPRVGDGVPWPTPISGASSGRPSWRPGNEPGPPALADRVKAETIKFFADGVIESGTAALIDEYCDQRRLSGNPQLDAGGSDRGGGCLRRRRFPDPHPRHRRRRDPQRPRCRSRRR